MAIRENEQFVSFAISKEIVSRLDKVARTSDLRRSQLLRRVVNDALRSLEPRETERDA